MHSRFAFYTAYSRTACVLCTGRRCARINSNIFSIFITHILMTAAYLSLYHHRNLLTSDFPRLEKRFVV